MDDVIDFLLSNGNTIEGGFWVLVGVCFAVSLCRPGQRRDKAIAAANFIVFGISDFVEQQTGAWWRPIWLMFWKGACFCVMAAQFWFYLRRRRAK